MTVRHSTPRQNLSPIIAKEDLSQPALKTLEEIVEITKCENRRLGAENRILWTLLLADTSGRISPVPDASSIDNW